MWGCPCFLCTIPFCLPRLKLRQCIFRIIGKRVKSFHKLRYCITLLLSVLYNTYCFAFQKHGFYTARQALLRSKTAVIAIPKRSYRFLTELPKRNPAFALFACGSCIRGFNLCVACRFFAVSSGELTLKKHLRDCLFKDNPADVFVISSSDQTVTIERKVVS